MAYVTKQSSQAEKYFTKLSISLAIRETKSKPTLRSLPLVRMAKIKKTKEGNAAKIFDSVTNKAQQVVVRMWGTGTLTPCWRKGKVVRPLWSSVWQLLKILEIDLLPNPALPLLST